MFIILGMVVEFALIVVVELRSGDAPNEGHIGAFSCEVGCAHCWTKWLPRHVGLSGQRGILDYLTHHRSLCRRCRWLNFRLASRRLFCGWTVFRYQTNVGPRRESWTTKSERRSCRVYKAPRWQNAYLPSTVALCTSAPNRDGCQTSMLHRIAPSKLN